MPNKIKKITDFSSYFVLKLFAFYCLLIVLDFKFLNSLYPTNPMSPIKSKEQSMDSVLPNANERGLNSITIWCLPAGICAALST